MIGPKTLFSVLVVFLSFGLVILSTLRLAQPQLLANHLSKPVFAWMLSKASSAGQVVPSVFESNPKKTVDYALVYPGILPNHPLYWLKMIRDHAKLSFIKDPLARFDLLVLYADKRLAAGQALFLQGDKQLAISTISKGEKYLLRAHEAFQNIPSTQTAIDLLKQQFAKALLKHQEVISSLQDKANDAEKKALQQAMDINTNLFNKEIKKYLPQGFSVPQSAPSAR